MPKMMPNILWNFIAPRATRRYPVEIRSTFPETRGRLVNDIDTCIFCGLCQRKCPSQCIEVDKHQATWTLTVFACVNCGVCADHCPTHSLSFQESHRPPARARFTEHLKGEIKKKKKDWESSDGPAAEDQDA
jgi:ech hydrogenase subunit F